MTNYVSTYWSRLTESSLCELVELVGERIPLPDIDTSSRDRIFNSWRIFWLFLGQVLSITQACREALIKARSWILLSDKKKTFQPIRPVFVRPAVVLIRATWTRCTERSWGGAMVR
jgi:hypothetical protein